VKRLALVCALVGCATVSVPRPPDQPVPAATELLQALQRRQAGLRTLEIETRTTSWLNNDRVRATVPMLVDRAGRLRFEAEVAVQGTVAALVVRGHTFAFLDMQHHVFHDGPACPANVGRLIPIPLLPEEIAAILLGDAPLGAEARAVDVGWDGQLKADVLALERTAAGAAASRLWITMKRTAAGYDILAVEGQSPGATARWRVAYQDLVPADGFTLPQLIRFAEPGKSFDQGVEIKVKERFGLNRPLRDDQFELKPPPGYAVQTLLCR
jgi:hypothetical protein